MSEIKKKLTEEMKSSLKAGEKDKLGFVRNLLSAVKKKEIDDRKDMTDEEIQKLITSLVKQRQDSISQFKQGGRDDLVAKEEAELKFLMSYMPEQMSEDEVRKLVDWAVTESGAKEPKDMGNVMKVLMPKLQGRADGKLVNQLVREKLG